MVRGPLFLHGKHSDETRSGYRSTEATDVRTEIARAEKQRRQYGDWRSREKLQRVGAGNWTLGASRDSGVAVK